MKTKSFLILCILIMHLAAMSQVKIGDNATTVNSASLLELETTNKGFVLPRVSVTSVNSSAPLAAGLLTGTIVYNTNSGITGGLGTGIYYWDGSKWNFLANAATSGNGWLITGNSGTSASSNFIGTTDAVDFVARTNNTERFRIASGGNVGIGIANPSYKLSVLAASNPLYLSGVQATATFTTDSVLTIKAGIVKKAPYSSLTGNFWNLTGNSGTNAASNFIGTSDAVDFVARTNNIERFRIASSGNVGIGVANPSYKLSVLAASDPLYLSGVQATSTFTADSVLTINAGVVKKTPYSSLTGNFWNLTGNNGTNAASNFIGTSDAVDFVARTNNIERLRIASSGNVGIGVANPSYKLSVLAASDPLYLSGVQATSTFTTDSVLTINAGVVKKTPYSSLTGNFWSITGNSGTNYANNFIGTTDNVSMRFRTNNTEQMIIDSLGHVGIGSSSFNALNPGKLLVDYGATTSNTIVNLKGNTDNYFQINLQNQSSGANSSSDYVATANDGTDSTFYVDLGINGGGYVATEDNWGGPHDAYLYTYGKNLVIGSQTTNGDVIFLLGGGRTKYNAVLRMDGATGNLIVGKGENQSNATGNIIRGPSGGNGTNIPGGSLTLQGGSSNGNTAGGNLNLFGGGTVSGTYGSVNINANTKSATNINTGTSASNITIGGTANNILLPKFNTVGGLYYTSVNTGQVSTTGSNMTWDSINNRLGIGITSPGYKLSVLSPSNPLYLSGVQATATFTTDSVLTINAGVVKKTPYSSLPGISSTDWSLTGNSGTNTATNFLGTTDNTGLVFRVNNTQAGYLATASSQATALGYNSSGTSTGQYGTAIGATAQATSQYASALGFGSAAAGQYSTSIGYNSSATSQYATAIGTGSSANNQYATALGYSSSATAQSAVALGYNSAAGNQDAIAIGNASNASVAQSIAIGKQAIASGFQGIALGNNSSAATGSTTLAIGVGSGATGFQATAIGASTVASNSQALAVGNNATASGLQSTAIGNGASATASNSTAIGNGATTTTANTLILGNGANVGIGTSAPSYKLSVLSPSNPLYLSGLQATSTFTSDSVLTVNAGVVKKAPFSTLTGNFWSLTGNTGLSASTNFIGTTDATDVVVKTNNTERMHILGSTVGSSKAGWTGMGITLPRSSLDVTGDFTNKNVITIQNTSSTGYSSVDMMDNSGNLKATFGYGNSGTGAFFGSRNYFSTYTSDFVLTNNNSNSYNFFMDGTSGNIGINTSNPSEGLDVASKNIIISNTNNTAGQLKFQEPSSSGSNYVAFKAPVTSTNTTYTLPSADGASGELLSTNGSGTLSWSSVGTAYSLNSSSVDPVTDLGGTYAYIGQVAVSVASSDNFLIQGYFSAQATSPSQNGISVRITRSTTSGSGSVGTVVAYAGANNSGNKYYSLPFYKTESGLTAGTWYYKIWATSNDATTRNYNITVLKVN